MLPYLDTSRHHLFALEKSLASGGSYFKTGDQKRAMLLAMPGVKVLEKSSRLMPLAVSTSSSPSSLKSYLSVVESTPQGVKIGMKDRRRFLRSRVKDHKGSSVEIPFPQAD